MAPQRFGGSSASIVVVHSAEDGAEHGEHHAADDVEDDERGIDAMAAFTMKMTIDQNGIRCR